MKNIISITFLIATLCLSASNTYATCTLKSAGWANECAPSEIVTTGIPASCGEGCTYTYNNGTLTIVADNANYEEPAVNTRFFAKSYRENNTFTDEDGNPITIENVIIDGELYFGQDAFHYLDANISGKDGTLILNNIGWNTFDRNTLTGNIIWKGWSYGGFNNATIDGNLIIEDTATVRRAGNGLSLGPNGKVFCKINLEDCQALLASANASDEFIAAAQPFPEGCSSLNLSGDCATCKGENFKLSDGYCYRVRYTPAEAAEVVGESNTIFLYYK